MPPGLTSEERQRLNLIMKYSDVVPTLLLSPVFSSYVVPALLPWRQQAAGVIAEYLHQAVLPALEAAARNKQVTILIQTRLSGIATSLKAPDSGGSGVVPPGSTARA
jgi:hypothetical protein